MLSSSAPMIGEQMLRRWAPLATVILALGAVFSPGDAAAATAALASCLGDEPSVANIRSPLSVFGGDLDGSDPAPIDAHPWIFARCERADLPFDCSLVSESDEDIVEVSAEGLEAACADQYQEERLLRFIPERPLLPARRYTLRCKSTPLAATWLYTDEAIEVDELPLATKASTSASLPPIDLDGATAELKRRDDTCCGGEPLYLDITVPESDDQDLFYREGGVIEVRIDADTYVYPGGSLPWTERGITLTAVGADGTRGEPLEIPAEAIDEELIYTNFDCALGRGLGGSSLWLMMPLVFLRISRRRARRRANANTNTKTKTKTKTKSDADADADADGRSGR